MNNTMCMFCKHEFEQAALNFPRILQAYDKIVIPRIQRDYAQGRPESHPTEVRKNLLSDIFGNSGQMDFGFVFGTQTFRKSGNRVDRCFVPIDGQQRLTTLFLLYLFWNWVSPCDKLSPQELQKFSYETREHAKAFCSFLTQLHINIEDCTSGIKEFLVNQVAFVDAWKTDPTVDGMLRMLKEIHSKYQESKKFPDLEKITFRFFDLEQFALSDALYIQMNARGWPLTAFESLKASLDKLAEQHHSEGDQWLEDWQDRIDGQWTKWFWQQYAKEDDGRSNPVLVRVDKPMLRTMARAIALFVLEQQFVLERKTEAGKFVPTLLSIIGDEAFFPNSLLLDTLSIPGNDGNSSCQEGLKFLRDFLDFIVSEGTENVIQPAWKKLSIHEFLSEGKELLYKRLLVLYAAFKCRDFKWMRVVWNIIENENIDSIERLFGAFRLLAELCPHANDIEEFLASDSSIKSDFAGDQVKEERLKARLLVGPDGAGWRKSIKSAEGHPLLRGNLSALLNATDITLADFEKRHCAFERLFTDGKEKQADGTHYLKICRAMLQLGDCRQSRKGHWLLPTCQFAFDSMLHFRLGQENFRKILHRLLEKFPNGLDYYSDQYVGNEWENVKKGWRYYFIKYSREFLKDGNGFYHWDNNTPDMSVWKMTSDNLRAYHCNPYLLAISDQQKDVVGASSRAGDGLLHLHGSNVVVGISPNSNGFFVRGVDLLNPINGVEMDKDEAGGYQLTIDESQDLIEFGKDIVEKLRNIR